MSFTRQNKKTEPSAKGGGLMKNFKAMGFGREARADAGTTVQAKAAIAHSPNPGAMAPRIPVLVDAKQVPQGRLVTDQLDLRHDLEKEFAVIEDSAGVTWILCSEACFGKPVMYDVLRRAERAGFSRQKIQPTHIEILKLVQGSHDAGRSNGISMHGADATSVEKLAAVLFAAAVEMAASDIHIETRELKHADIFLRVHGERVFYRHIAYTTAKALMTSLYAAHADVGSKDTTWDLLRPKEALIDHTLTSGIKIGLRFCSTPIHPSGNFQAVMRVLGASKKALGLDQVGLTGEQVAVLKNMLIGAKGLVLLVGPTNGGKSTMMQAMMRYILERRGQTTKIIMIEDPVEYEVPGATQTSVPRKTSGEVEGASMADFLRAALRQDPDVVCVGEIRDAEVADLVKDATLSGRKTTSTLHAFSAIGAFERLRELGVPLRLLTMPGFISGIIFSRLVPTLCDCAQPLSEADAQGRIPPDVLERVKRVADLQNDGIRIRRGCAICNQTGVKGRTTCSEFIVPERDHLMLKLIAQDRLIEAQNHWIRSDYLSIDGMGPTALAHAISKMKQGLIDPTDIEDQVNTLTADIDVMAEPLAAHGAAAEEPA
ncbi:GspE/PulE family protein [Noviherbaspirillum galbum]|uniref:Flp pilus assembly complex ATPase component n=1 Tax=Noviherbaspirillum galbum TaxID=2709383 RepID=A0A6B3SZS8_9BURK|nr:ATPase, T2SS/T4P/T4SS family [Noviherbaspirillum galbum]NEX64529.1 Flp pilus assembly complex ATPase component [Noviherbaspirillum galbum]